MILANVRRLRRLLDRLTWEPDESVWSGYATSHSYTEAGTRLKEEFVASVAGERPRSLVWDLGANTGVFSRLVAPHARCVVAMDGDPVAIERLYRSLEPPRQRTILPLVVDLADPSPGLGWRGAERPPLADRGRPDLVLALALLHHLTLARNVPLAEVVQWLLDLGGELVVEFVHRDDPMIALLLRNKTDTYADYDRAAFEGLLRVRAQIVRQTTVPGDTRTLYHVRPRS
jgi:ribosomal protein L11 methylase PrmA